MSSEAFEAPGIGAALRESFVSKVMGRQRTAQAQPRALMAINGLPKFGSAAKGLQLLAGNLQLGGDLISLGSRSIWSVRAPDPLFEDELHGFTWLDDLATLGGFEARRFAQVSLATWIAKFGHKSDWTPDLAGQRLLSWANNAVFLMPGQTVAEGDAYLRSFGEQASYVATNWKKTTGGLPRFEALAGLLFAGLSLEGMDHMIRSATSGLAQECGGYIAPDGSIPSRNPEELLGIYTLLTWVDATLHDAGRTTPNRIANALKRIAPVVGALRHSDGSLARFHGGRRAKTGQLASAPLSQDAPLSAMGYTKLGGGDFSLIVDTGAPSTRKAPQLAHASTLAFELTCGTKPLIVNCGSGMPFGIGWHRIGRMTQSHSTLSVDGDCSAKFNDDVAGAFLTAAPRSVTAQATKDATGQHLLSSHSGYEPVYGLTHARQLSLSTDGDALTGEDTFAALTDKTRCLFEHHMNESLLTGLNYHIRFHLHPDVKASLDMNGTAVSLRLGNGDLWVFRHQGAGTLRLEPSVYLEAGRVKPRLTKQMTLSVNMMHSASQCGWSLTRS